jgi:hypothetical protein
VFGDTPPTVIALDPALEPTDLKVQLVAQFMRQPTWIAVAGQVRAFDPDGDFHRALSVQETLADTVQLPILRTRPEAWPRNAIACFNIAHDELGQAWPLGGVAPLRAGVSLCRELGSKRLQIWTHHESRFLQERDAFALEMAQQYGIEFRVESPLLSKAP